MEVSVNIHGFSWCSLLTRVTTSQLVTAGPARLAQSADVWRYVQGTSPFTSACRSHASVAQ